VIAMKSHAERLRIGHVTLSLDVGGQEKLLTEFARHANRERFALTFVSLTGRGKLADNLEGLGCRVITLHEPAGLRPGMVWRLRRLFRTERFNVVHTHDDKPLVYGAPAAWFARVRRRIHTLHHSDIPQTSRRQRLLMRWAARLVRPFVCVSHDSARYAAEHGIAAARLRVLWNGIDLERFPYQGPQTTGPAVTVARLSPEKDVQNLLRAARLIADAHPDFRLEIAGDGPCREELLRLAGELRLGEHVRFLGEVSEVPALLARASVFVLPSQSEGISLTILEAMASGLPVVATRVGGNPEVIDDGRTGVLVPPRNPAALAHAIGRMIASPDEAQRFARAGRHRAEAHFDVRKMVAQYEALYEPDATTAHRAQTCQPETLARNPG
jgi:glycosyltransferase involved in cell wall biosynthesis